MKLFVVFALLVVAIVALPIEEANQEGESPLTLVDLEAESSDNTETDVARPKRQFGGFGYGAYPGNYGGYGGYGHGAYGGYRPYGGYGNYGNYGNYGGYGGYGHGHRPWGK